MLKDLIIKNRSYRRFDQYHPVGHSALTDLIDLARLSPSAANLQPLKYILVTDQSKCAEVFSCLAWAGYLTDWPGPAEGERPGAYIVVLNDTKIARKTDCDHGIAAQSILLGASERGLGGCIIGSIKRDELRELLAIDEYLDILLVIALGKPREIVKLQNLSADGSIEYWRDSEGTHFVPKRPLSDLIIAKF